MYQERYIVCFSSYVREDLLKNGTLKVSFSLYHDISYRMYSSDAYYSGRYKLFLDTKVNRM